MLLYACTIFLSAFLLFQVQPMIAKIILPWFGGTAAVWTTCMLFFQVTLLLGYLYAHWLISSLSPKRQPLVHGVLLLASLLALPVAPREFWKPGGQENPILWILAVLGASVGLPFFLLSTTGPLLQAWYARRVRDGLPYWLFALSNGGSMLALLSYPALVEPFLPTHRQVQVWSGAYACFVLLCGVIALLGRTGARELQEDSLPVLEKPNWELRLLWMGLAACASTLLLAITNHLCQNVAPIPLLWVLPLSLYLLSFILCFAGRSWYRRTVWLQLTAVALGSMAYLLLGDFDNVNPKLLVPLFGSALFLCSMACHGELAGLKPHPCHLTSFYLMVALGGALGGVFVGVIAPWLFRAFWELPVGLAGCALLLLTVLYRDPASRIHRARWQAGWLGLSALTIAFLVTLGVGIRREMRGYKLVVRSFYGVLRVSDEGEPGEADYLRRLTNGTINHGEQFLDPGRHRQPTTYYGPSSGVGLAILTDRPAHQKVGVIGLGAGVLGSYCRLGDEYRFYEINPAVVSAARGEFSFLGDCPGELEVAMGDARLSLEREANQNYDVLAVDAFASDSIPVHLLTREAFALYFRHVKPEGILAVHISNKYLELEPVVERAARALGKDALVVDSDKDEKNGYFSSLWALVASPGVLDRIAFRNAGARLQAKASLRMWTDDYSSLFPILK